MKARTLLLVSLLFATITVSAEEFKAMEWLPEPEECEYEGMIVACGEVVGVIKAFVPKDDKAKIGKEIIAVVKAAGGKKIVGYATMGTYRFRFDNHYKLGDYIESLQQRFAKVADFYPNRRPERGYPIPQSDN